MRIVKIVIAVCLLLMLVLQIGHIRYNRWVMRVAILRAEYCTLQIDRISFCSIREFPGRTALGLFSSENQVAVSRDLQEYLGWWAYIPDVSDQPFLVTCLTNKRFKKTVDCYTYQPVEAAAKLGIMSGKVTFVSPRGITLLGEL